MDVLKIKDRFGAIENYPHIKRGGKSKKKGNAVVDPFEDNGNPIGVKENEVVEQ